MAGNHRAQQDYPVLGCGAYAIFCGILLALIIGCALL